MKVDYPIIKRKAINFNFSIITSYLSMNKT